MEQSEHKLSGRTYPSTTFCRGTGFIDMRMIARDTFGFILKAFSKSGGGLNSHLSLTHTYVFVSDVLI